MSRFISGLVTVLVLHVAFRTALADSDGRTPGPARDAVQRAFQAEIDGSPAERVDKLNEALKADPKSKDARWQSGQVQHEGKWVDFKSFLSQLASEEVMHEYRGMRDAAPMTVRAQLDVANWCRAHKLKEQERAHLTAALEISDDSDNALIRKRLGQRMIHGVWMSETEIQKGKSEQAEASRNLKTWQSSIQKSAKRLGHRSDEVRETARRELKAIVDPKAIPALESGLAEAGIEEARLLVELLGSMKTYKAAAPLAKLAVMSEWEVVRKEAAVKLRERPVGAYAPELLSTMRTPIESKLSLLVGLDGVHVSHRLSSESEYAAKSFERQRSTFVTPVGPGSGGSITGAERDRNRLKRAQDQAVIEARLDARRVEREVEDENRSISDWNGRVCALLKEATGVSLPADPEKWWEWWRDYNQLSEVRKQYESDYSYEERTEYVESAPIVASAPRLTAVSAQTECLVAGTPLWTDRGLLAIEAVKVGDLVLSKHPESGELAYQPVLKTSVREPEPVFKVTTDEGDIRATGGHVFWISGQGWTRLRDVRPDQRFHGAMKPAVIRSLVEDGRDKTYNLVVADFHTYFVGSDLVLSHDLTFARPIDVVVPGMKVE